MKNKYALLIATGLLAALFLHACKKTGQNPIPKLFTGGTWELASVQTQYWTGNQQDSTVIDTSRCITSQYFTFNADNTCTYKNFDCVTQTTTAAPWSLTANQLFLQANVVSKDTTKAGSSMPFNYSFIQNLGEYSMVLWTGDIQPNYSLTAKRKIHIYGFIRQLAP